MISFILKHRLLILICGIVITLALGINSIFLSIDGGFMSVLPTNDPDFQYNSYVEETFGDADELIILVENENGIFNDNTLTLIDSLTNELSKFPEVDEYMIISVLSYGGENWSKLKEELDNDPFVSDFLVGNEDKTTMIVAPVSNKIALSNESLKILAENAQNLVSEYNEKYPEIDIFVTGHPIVNAEITKKMINDLFVLFPAAIFTVAVILLIILQSFRGMLIPLAVTLASILWTFGLKGILRTDLTITETVIPVILISIASADGIHIVSEAFHYMHKGYSSKVAVRKTISNLWKPIVLTSITTAVGFASFAFSPGKSLRHMGLFLAFGVIAAMLFSLVIIPILLSYYKPLKEHKDRKHYKRQVHLLGQVSKVVQSVTKRKVFVLVTAIIILGFSVYGMLNINTETDEIRYFKKDNPVRQSAEFIEEELGGISVLQIVLESNTDGAFQKIENLEKLTQFQEILNQREEVSQTISIADYVKYIFFQFRGKNPDYFQIPSNQPFLKGLLNGVVRNEDPRSKAIFAYTDENFRRVKISVRLNDSNSRAIAKLIYDTEPELVKLFGDSVTIGYAGDYLRLKNGEMIVKSQIMSLVTTIFIIIVILSILFKSPISGFLVAVPVIVAVLFNFAIMWLFNVSLNPATAIIAAVGLGVGVDYSIHLFSRYQLHYKKSGKHDQSLIDAISEVSRGILSNALSVGCGFLILLLSAYRIINDMGWIIALSMLTTSLASIILLPVLISLIHIKRGN